MKPRLIAEAGCNHKGDLNIAFEMIDIAADYIGADVIKFQKRNNRELMSEEQYNSPHPVPENSYGKTYGEHREFLEFTAQQHKELKDYCEKKGITYSTSVWDMTSTKEIAALNPKLIKIPSAINNHYEMLNWLAENYQGEIHISLGMSTHNEEDKIYDLFKAHNRLNDLVLYSCTSGYPVPFEDIALLEISRLKEKFEGKIKEIGFSGHHLGIAVDVAALTLGARTIERHYTLDRTWKGTDHSASLEPDGLRKLKRDLDAVDLALDYKKDEILPIEKVQRDKLKYKG